MDKFKEFSALLISSFFLLSFLSFCPFSQTATTAFAGAGDFRRSFRWPNNTIYIDTESQISGELQDTVIDVIDAIDGILERRAGIKIRECGGGTRCPVPPVTVRQTSNNLCEATVGFRNDERIQFINLHRDCDRSKIIHEIGHSLGLYHEHQRTDRNWYIKVNTGNTGLSAGDIRSNYGIEFDSLNQGRYDYDSLMHYSRCEFIARGRSCATNPVIEQPDGTRGVGNRFNFSDSDLKALASLYGRNFAPMARDDNYNFPAGESTYRVQQKDFQGTQRSSQDFGLRYNDYDYDGDIASIQVVRQPKGTLSNINPADGGFTFSFKGNDNSDSFTYRLRDSRGNISNLATVTLRKGNIFQRRISVIRPVNGDIRSEPAGFINCGANDVCTLSTELDEITLIARAREGWVFKRWNGDGDCTGTSSSILIRVDDDISCEAIFERRELARLSIGVNAGGIVTASTGNIRCGTFLSQNAKSCQSNYINRAIVDLTARPSSGYRFVRWGGDCSGSSRFYTITMRGNQSCTARFEPTKSRRTLIISKGGKGSITSTPSGINCGTNCFRQENLFNSNTNVTLRAVPTSGYRFNRWTGDCYGMPQNTTIRMNEDKRCTAFFVKYPSNPNEGARRALFIQKTGEGSVTSSPTGINCKVGCGQNPCGSGAGKCENNFNLNSTVRLTAIPATGYRFSRWSGNCSGTSTITIIRMNANSSCTANFVKR